MVDCNWKAQDRFIKKNGFDAPLDLNNADDAECCVTVLVVCLRA